VLLAAITLDMSPCFSAERRLLPIFADNGFCGATGLVSCARAAAGAVLMSFALAHKGPFAKAVRPAREVAAFGLATILLALPILLLSLRLALLGGVRRDQRVFVTR